jgi:hypothetical protein
MTPWQPILSHLLAASNKEIAYLAVQTTGGSMLLLHVPVYGPLRGEIIWQIFG